MLPMERRASRTASGKVARRSRPRRDPSESFATLVPPCRWETSASRSRRPRASALEANVVVADAAFFGATPPTATREKPSYDRREPVFHARGGRKRKGESPRRLRGDRWGKGKEEYAPGSLIVSIWYRTNRRGEYNVLATLCKGLGTRILKFFCALHPQRLIKTYNIRCSRCIPGSKCCENTKFRRVVAALHFTPVFGCTPLCGWGVESPSRVDLRRVTVEAVTRRFEVLPRVAPTAQEP
jgi:hypothetical protein